MRNIGLWNQARSILNSEEIFPSFRYKREHNISLVAQDGEFLQNINSEYATIDKSINKGSSSRFFRLQDVYIYSNVLYFLHENKLVTCYETYRPNDRPYVTHLDLLPEQVISSALYFSSTGPIFYVGSAGSSNYGHWLVDDLPRIRALQAIAQASASNRIEILLPGYSDAINAVRQESVRVFTPAEIETTICFVPANQILHFDEVFYVSPVSYHPAVKSPDACEFVRAGGRGVALATIPQNRTRRLYVTRSATHGRVITNGPNVEMLFGAFGFTIIDIEGMTFEQQVATFADAHFVAGCMGAAMTNTLFCEPGTTVLQLAPEGWREPFYWDLASVCGHRYAAFYGQVINRSIEPHLADFTINIEQLAAHVLRLL